MRKGFVYCLVLFIASSCELLAPEPGVDSKMAIDNSTRINLPAQNKSASTEWTYCEPITFNLEKYQKIDSIIFVPNVRSQSKEMKCIAELYDFQNNIAIPNSRVESVVQYTLHLVRSNNLRMSFPNTNNNIGIRFRSSDTGHYVEVGVNSHVLIYHGN